MLSPCPLLDVKVVLVQGLKPTGHLACRMLEVQVPGKRSMVDADDKVAAMQIWPEVLYCLDHGQQLSLCDIVILFCLTQAR